MAGSCKIFCQISCLHVLGIFLVFLLVRIMGFILSCTSSCLSVLSYGLVMAYVPDAVSEAVHPIMPLLLWSDMETGLLFSGMLFAHHTGCPGVFRKVCVWMAGEQM